MPVFNSAAPNWTKVQDGAHPDGGAIEFDPGVANSATPVLYANDGGVYRNARSAAPTAQPRGSSRPGRPMR